MVNRVKADCIYKHRYKYHDKFKFVVQTIFSDPFEIIDEKVEVEVLNQTPTTVKAIEHKTYTSYVYIFADGTQFNSRHEFKLENGLFVYFVYQCGASKIEEILYNIKLIYRIIDKNCNIKLKK
jgi:hypothetical protein